jgi:hypothetical protein
MPFSVFLVDAFQGVCPTKCFSVPHIPHLSHLPIISKPFKSYYHKKFFAVSKFTFMYYPKCISGLNFLDTNIFLNNSSSSTYDIRYFKQQNAFHTSA